MKSKPKRRELQGRRTQNMLGVYERVEDSKREIKEKRKRKKKGRGGGRTKYSKLVGYKAAPVRFLGTAPRHQR